MDVKKLLSDSSNRDNVIVDWIEPYEGMESDMKNCTVCVTKSASVGDCIKIQRYINQHLCKVGDAGPKEMTDEELLLEFMAVNWAEIKE